MKFCQKCGSEMDDTSLFCPACGTPVEGEKKSFNPTSFILGILGIIFAWFLAIVGHVLSIIGIVLGVQEYKRSKNVLGLVFSILGEICSIISSVVGVLIMLGIMASFI